MENELAQSITDFVKEELPLEEFKMQAMNLARQGVELDTLGYQYTLLHCLIQSNKNHQNDTEIEELLALQKDKLEAQDIYDRSALVMLIEQFLQEKCSLEDFKNNALLLARGGANLSVMGGGNPSYTLLHCLVLSNDNGINDDAIQELAEIKSNIFELSDSRGLVPIEALLHAQPNTPTDVIIRLITMGNALEYGNLLHRACYAGNLELAQYLVNEGLSAAAKSDSGRTAFHFATGSKNPALWQWLYDQGVNPDARDNLNRTALHQAIINKNLDMVEWLIAHNVDIQAKDQSDNTALSLAQAADALDIVALLEPIKESPQSNLFKAIQALDQYGNDLNDQGIAKGQIAIELAAALRTKADEFFRQEATEEDIAQFVNEFSDLLNSKNSEMRVYSANYSTIIANILIALTGIGAVVLAGKVAYSMATEGRPLFFFQENKTTGEVMIDNINEAISPFQNP